MKYLRFTLGSVNSKKTKTILLFSKHPQCDSWAMLDLTTAPNGGPFLLKHVNLPLFMCVHQEEEALPFLYVNYHFLSCVNELMINV